MRSTFLIIFAISLTSIVQGQDIRVGVKGGYNIVSVHRVAQVNNLRQPETLSSRDSYHVGLTSNIQLNDAFGLYFEPAYVRKGVIRGGDQLEWLSYLETPILVSVNPWKHLFIETGPSAGFLLNASQEDAFGVRNKLVTNKRELSLIFGMSWDVHERFNVGSRFVRSVTPVSEIQFTNESGFVTDEFEEYNQYVEFFARIYILNK